MADDAWQTSLINNSKGLSLCSIAMQLPGLDWRVYTQCVWIAPFWLAKNNMFNSQICVKVFTNTRVSNRVSIRDFLFERLSIV